MSKYWKPQPLNTLVLELLRKKQNALTDAELLKSMVEIYDDLDMYDLNRVLMKLEVDGLIHVHGLTKVKRRVELAKT